MIQRNIANLTALADALEQEISQNSCLPDAFYRYQRFFQDVRDKFIAIILERTFYHNQNPYCIFDFSESALIYLYYNLPVRPLKRYSWNAVSDVVSRIRSSFTGNSAENFTMEFIQQVIDMVENTYRFSESSFQNRYLLFLRIPHIHKGLLGEYTHFDNAPTVCICQNKSNASGPEKLSG